MTLHSVSPRPIRLAEREALAVDLCSCGTLAVHMGALSLRLDLESVTSLIEVLRDAVAKREALAASASASAHANEALPERGSPWSSRRGRHRGDA